MDTMTKISHIYRNQVLELGAQARPPIILLLKNPGKD